MLIGHREKKTFPFFTCTPLHKYPLIPRFCAFSRLPATFSSRSSHSIIIKPKMSTTPFSRTKFEELMKRKFFYAPAFSIYGGVAGLYDYGPPGCALQANIIDLWRKHFILEEHMLEVDCTIMTPFDVLKTSGHVDRFSDYMVTDSKTGDFFRADHLIEAFFERLLASNPKDLSPELRLKAETVLAQIDGIDMAGLQALINEHAIKSDLGNPLTPVSQFNLMFGTEIGPTGYLKAFLRPETAQGQFVNFKRLLECNNQKMPFASAMIGKSFRNEISPRSGLLRVREFLMAEIEHYVHPAQKDHPKFASVANFTLSLLPSARQVEGSSETIRMSIGQAVAEGIVNNQTLGYYLVRVAQFLLAIGIKSEALRFRQHMPNEMAHYASDCWDAEIKNSYGWIECVGCADRAAYDLSVHTKRTKERLVASEKHSAPITVTRPRAVINKKDIGILFKKESKAIVEHLENDVDLACVNIPYSFSLNGTAYSLDASLFNVEMITEVEHVREYIPNVIEPSFGIGRIIYSLLEHSFWNRQEDENRCVLSLPPVIAPWKAMILPLSSNQVFDPIVQELSSKLKAYQIAFDVEDSSASIGKRYARNDELGIPFFLTVDFQSVQDASVTVRERDTTRQIRVPVAQAAPLIHALSLGVKTWEMAEQEYPLFVGQDLEIK